MDIRVIYQVLKADFLERVRKPSFSAICFVVVLLAFFSVPDIEAPFVSIAMEPDIFSQGTNPSWIPIAIALCGGILFPVIGLAYVKSNISADRDSNFLYVMQSMNMKKSNYIIGKFLSNLFILTLMWILVIISATFMLCLRFTGKPITIYDFLSPFICIYPGIIFTAAFSVFLESTAVFSKRTGNAIGITILFTMFLINYFNSESKSLIFRVFDFSSYRWVMDSINAAVIPIIGHAVWSTGILVPGGMLAESMGNKELIFHGLTFSGQYLIDKMILISVCIILVLSAVILLDTNEKEKKKQVSKIKSLREKTKHSHYMCELAAEFHITFNGLSKYWFLIMLCLWAASIFAPMKYAQNYIWIVMLFFSVSIFSQIGSRDYESGLTEYFITIKNALLKQMIYSYFCGTVFLSAVTCPVIVRAVIEQNYLFIPGYILFVIFVPALACFLGEYTKSRRAFETIYLLFCFLLINVPSFLFIGYVNIIMAIGSVVLLSAAFFKRAVI